MVPGAMAVQAVPDVLPVLSRGRHRSPRRGACFMEMASYLAGERWSDHPACTHPLLASVARCVNDRTSDAGRQRLGLLVPAVVGLTSSDPHLEPRLARAAAARALPVVAQERQHVLAVGVLTSDAVLAQLDDRDPTDLEPATRAALAPAPGARRWAQRFTAEQGGVPRAVRARVFTRETAPHVVLTAVAALASTQRPDVDERLHDLLAELVDITTAHADRPAGPAAGASAVLDADRWADAVRLTRSGR